MKKMMIVHQKKVLGVLPVANVTMDTLCLPLMALLILAVKKHIYITVLQILAVKNILLPPRDLVELSETSG